MARLRGGIFSRPSGHNNGLVFGAGRTKQGKVATTRELVIPANPKTEKQTKQRGRFAQAVAIVVAFGASIYQEAFNRANRNLPGFQSLQSIFISNLSDDGKTLSVPGPVTLGSLPPAEGLTAVVDSGSPKISWEEVTGNGASATDQSVILFIQATNNGAPQERLVHVDKGTTRTTKTKTLSLTGPQNVAGVVGIYFVSSDPDAVGNKKYSPVRWTAYTP